MQPKPKPKRTRRNDPQGLRGRLLDVAATLFQSSGYHATSMQDVMKLAGVTGGALHHHFSTKQSLGLAVIEERVAPAVRETWIDPLGSASSLGKGVAAVFGDIIAGVEKRGAIAGCPLNNLALELALADPEFRYAINTIFTEWQAALAESISGTRGGAQLDRAKRMEAAAFIVSIYSGSMTLAKSAQNAAPLRSGAANLSRWLREREFAA